MQGLRRRGLIYIIVMNTSLRIKISENKFFYKEKMKILSLGVCNAILPVSVINYQSGAMLVYDRSGFVQLKELHQTSAEEVLIIAGLFISAIDELKDYAFFPDEIEINENSVFISENKRELRIAPIPAGGRGNENNNILYFFVLLKQHADAKGKAYLDSLVSLAARGNFSTKNILTIIDEMRAEINGES